MKKHYRMMARYHDWAYLRLYDDFLSAEHLSEEDYRADVGLFFRSIHGTLNHLLLAERVWYGRIQGWDRGEYGHYWEKDASEWEKFITDRDELKKALHIQIRDWIDFTDNLDDNDFGRKFRYKNSRGEELTGVLGPILAHVFNHGTHHRAQITAALTSQGRDCPELDLLYYLRPDA